jgi:universal stress protein A
VNHYQHVLFAADLSNDALQVGSRAKAIAHHSGARLSVIHVVEQAAISGGYELLPIIPELPPATLIDKARDALARLVEGLEVQGTKPEVITAVSTKEGILQTAAQRQVDLIVVGSHGRHGLALLLGSTANAVLHGAPCDVLAVRIRA